MGELRSEFELFSELLECPPEQRDELLDRRCADDRGQRARLKALLAAHEEADRVQRSTLRSPETVPRLPERIGGYRVLSRLGEGGMGVVYAAEQARPIRRRVAVKVLKSGSDSKEILGRFDAERQALALMNHANIAQILDAGVHEGRPFFVMELIAGVPITEYCDRGRLSVPERLELFALVCEGVQHAHQKGVIHRDLKPSNILVTDEGGQPTPKIIDFGIAKAVTDRLFEATVHTEVGRIIGTPDYMSPEQADVSALDIDTRTDVYSLGALLYELLCGFTVFGLHEGGAGLDEIREAIAHREPSRPSDRLARAPSLADTRAGARGTSPETLVRLLRQDLDWITLKALDKDRTRRYASASELANDVRRFLRAEAVVARPPSAGYRVGKFVRRNRAGVLAAGAVGATVLGASVVSVFFALQASRERARAEGRAATLERVAAFESARLRDLSPRAIGESLRAGIVSGLPEERRGQLEEALAGVNFTTVAMDTLNDNIFRETIEAIEREFRDDPILRARLLHSTGSIMLELGLSEEALRPQRQALALRREHLGDADPDTLASVRDTGVALAGLGRYQEAEPLYREALATATAIHGPEHEETYRASNNLGHLLHQTGAYEEAESLYTSAYQGHLALHGPEHEFTLGALINLGYLAQQRGQLDKAEEYLTRAVETSRRVFTNDESELLGALANMGGLMTMRGRLDEAVPYFREALEGFRRTLGDKHPDTLILVSNTGYLLQELGRYDEAEACYREALDSRLETLGPEHPLTLTSISNMASLLQERGDPEAAYPLYRNLYDTRVRTLGQTHPSTLNSMITLGSVLRALGRLPESHELTSGAVVLTAEHLDPTHSLIGSALAQHTRTLLAMERYAEAADHARRAYDQHLETLGPGHAKVAESAGRLADVHRAWHEADPAGGHDAEAEAWASLGARGDSP
ncbi:MAG: tetratricopeptide repeat protein [Phycisphaerales bacterium JB040]